MSWLKSEFVQRRTAEVQDGAVGTQFEVAHFSIPEDVIVVGP
jgi:hypothetical protein